MTQNDLIRKLTEFLRGLGQDPEISSVDGPFQDGPSTTFTITHRVATHADGARFQNTSVTIRGEE